MGLSPLMGKHSAKSRNMSNRGKSRPRGNDSDENLRGRLRELEKKNTQLLRYVQYLEKSLSRQKPIYESIPIEEEKTKTKNTKNICEKCKSENVHYVDTFKINDPVVIKYCQDCGHRTVIK